MRQMSAEAHRLNAICPSADYSKATDPFNKMKELFKFQ